MFWTAKAGHRAKRPADAWDVAQPEGENRVGSEIIGEGNDRYQRAKCDDAELEAEAEGLGRQIPGRCPQRKCEEDRPPIEQLAPPGDDGVN